MCITCVHNGEASERRRDTCKKEMSRKKKSLKKVKCQSNKTENKFFENNVGRKLKFICQLNIELLHFENLHKFYLF